jgi:hypothetical protein
VELIQTYETTVTEPGTGLAFSFLVVPSRSFPDGDTPPADDLTHSLEIYDAEQLEPSALALLTGVVALLRSSNATSGWREELSERTHDPYVPEREFAEIVTFGEVVPIEHSPLGAESLAGILTKAGGGAVGLIVGVASSGGTPLLLLTVPAGMILCGAAAGIASALEQGLRRALLRKLGVEEGQGAGAGASR